MSMFCFSQSSGNTDDSCCFDGASDWFL